jgi:hypothetical protein
MRAAIAASLAEAAIIADGVLVLLWLALTGRFWMLL